MKKYRLFFVFSALSLLIFFNLSAQAQGRIPVGWNAIGTQFIPGQPDALFAARLQNPLLISRTKSATVLVSLAGINLVDPTTTGGKAVKGQGHIRYKLDDEPIVDTTETQHTFFGLCPGYHKIRVMLVGNDSKPLGPEEMFGILIAEKAKDKVLDPKFVFFHIEHKTNPLQIER